jgi:hypothetical protein
VRPGCRVPEEVDRFRRATARARVDFAVCLWHVATLDIATCLVIATLLQGGSALLLPHTAFATCLRHMWQQRAASQGSPPSNMALSNCNSHAGLPWMKCPHTSRQQQRSQGHTLEGALHGVLLHVMLGSELAAPATPLRCSEREIPTTKCHAHTASKLSSVTVRIKSTATKSHHCLPAGIQHSMRQTVALVLSALQKPVQPEYSAQACIVHASCQRSPA